MQWFEFFNAQPIHAMESVVQSTEDVSQNLTWLVAVFLTILLLIAVSNVISSLQPFGMSISNLFLKIKINPLKPSSETSANSSHLREVRGNTATLITSTKLKKGEQIEIDVSSLPNFPERNIVLPAKVSHIETVRGSNSYLTEIRFKRSEGPVVRSLVNYVRRLSRAPSNW